MKKLDIAELKRAYAGEHRRQGRFSRRHADSRQTVTPGSCWIEKRRAEVGGGDEEDRTPDLGIANAALSQLSYVPGDRLF